VIGEAVSVIRTPPAGRQDQEHADHTRNADDEGNDDVWADGRIHDQLGDDRGDLTRDAAEE
jgi:hypothetical protein